MDLGLPEILKAAISSACQSGRDLSWKIQEGKKGTLIQMIWDPQPKVLSEKSNEVRSIRNKTHPSSNMSAGDGHKKRLPPSKVKRNQQGVYRNSCRQRRSMFLLQILIRPMLFRPRNHHYNMHTTSWIHLSLLTLNWVI